MSSHEVDGVTLPDPVAGHPALDFCNTRAGWNAEHPKEYLVEPGILAVWVGEAGLLSIEDALRLREERWPAAVLERALALREALYPVLLGRGTAADWSVVSEEAAQGRGRARLVPVETVATQPGNTGPGTTGTHASRTLTSGAGATEPARWQPIWSGPDTALHVIAASAADFLTGPRAGAVGACPGEGCGWLFTDPRGRRRWCSMAVCGNRAKARRFRNGYGPGEVP
jgi:predicted RNA-binding Zn ribbon-like protein